ncbi:hypothetical protein [Chthonobacter rhizosphaerae]|uniref:hypothetical protein n=1 Tax=Chthonobacter rhizosphaerae TaxID=2735553 RepID=UPI0015EF7EAE|nr:hypothetical protein [Chthonobacter rhizosphaerae]
MTPTQADLIAALPAGRLPSTMMQLQAGDILAVVGIGLVLGACLAMLLAPFVGRAPSRRARIRATRGLPAEERALEVARVLGHLPDALRPTAYGAAPALPDDEIERVALTARRARR